MKRNKIAAGALALALGFGAVAPSFADEAKAETSTRLFQEQYKTVLDRTNKERADYLAAKAARDTAKSNLDAAKETLAKELAEYEKFWDALNTRINAYNDAVTRAAAELALYSDATTVTTWEEEPIEITVADLPFSNNSVVYKTQTLYLKKAIVTTGIKAKPGKEAEFEVAKKRLANAEADRLAILETVGNKADQLQKVIAAEGARDVAQTAYDKAEAELAKHYVGGDLKGKTIWETSLADVQAAAHGYNVTVEAVDGKIVIVEEKAETDAEKRAKLQEAIDRAKTQIQAVKFLKEKTPETIKGIVKELDALVKEQEARIATAEAALAKTTASVFTTVYADEDVDFDKLADELNESSDKIDSLLEENEKEQAEKADEEKVEDADDDKEDDDKEEEKTEEKTDDKKEDDKKVIEKTTTVVTPATTNKTAGSNAKTGIAGVAGVAGILAAASAAYAASKKN